MWDFAFGAGSFLAALGQGVALSLTPIFYEAAHTWLFSPPLVYIFGVIPVRGCLKSQGASQGMPVN